MVNINCLNLFLSSALNPINQIEIGKIMQLIMITEHNLKKLSFRNKTGRREIRKMTENDKIHLKTTFIRKR